MIFLKHTFCLEKRNDCHYFVIELPIQLPILMMIDPQNAGAKPLISMPSRTCPAKSNIPALMTNMKRPNDITTIGKLINASIGLRKVFKKPMNTDAMIAEKKFFTQIPSTKYCVRYTALAVMTHRMNSEVMCSPGYNECYTVIYEEKYT